MPIENATYIDELVATNPVGATDDIDTIDNQVRLVKSVLQNSLPSISGPVTATDTELSQLAGVSSTTPVTLTGTTNSFNVGSETGSHLAFSPDIIQAKSNATTATDLNISPLGGATTVGGVLNAASALNVAGASALTGALTANGATTLNELVTMNHSARMIITDDATDWFDVTPGSNPVSTYTALSVEGTTPATDKRVFLGHFELNSDEGSTHTGSATDKVSLYAGVRALNGSGDVWAFNTVTTLDSGLSGDLNTHGYELDFNNLYKDIGASDFTYACYGMSITGAGAYKSTAALGIFGQGSGGSIWYRGILFGNDSIHTNAVEDQTNCDVTLKISGIHNYGIDAFNMSGTPLRIGNNAPIVARNSGDTLDVRLLELSTSNEVYVGNTTSTDLYLGPPTMKYLAGISGGTTTIYGNNTANITVGSNTLGFFGGTATTKKTITGVTDQQSVLDFLQAMEDYGLITSTVTLV